jgi:hypothetical protein
MDRPASPNPTSSTTVYTDLVEEDLEQRRRPTEHWRAGCHRATSRESWPGRRGSTVVAARVLPPVA